MAQSIKRRVGAMSGNKDNRELRKLMSAIRVDIVALATALDVLAAKLNADGGVTDEDYSIVNAAAVTLAE